MLVGNKLLIRTTYFFFLRINMDFEGKYNVKSPGKQADMYTTYCNKVLLKLFLLEIYPADFDH